MQKACRPLQLLRLEAGDPAQHQVIILVDAEVERVPAERALTVAVVSGFLAHEPASIVLGLRGVRAKRELGDLALDGSTSGSPQDWLPLSRSPALPCR